MKYYQLNNSWGALAGDVTARLESMLSGCTRLSHLVRVVNTICRTIGIVDFDCTPLLPRLHDLFLQLVPQCEKVKQVVAATRAIARATKCFDVDWGAPLDTCRTRLQELLPLCNDITEAAAVMDCIASIAPLIGTQLEEKEDVPKPAPVATPQSKFNELEGSINALMELMNSRPSCLKSKSTSSTASASRPAKKRSHTQPLPAYLQARNERAQGGKKMKVGKMV